MSRKAEHYLLESMLRPFHWRDWNCVVFCAGYVLAATGVDPLTEADRVTSLRQAKRRTEALGGLLRAVSDRLGEPIDPKLARPGDLVLIRDTQGVGDSLGVCNGASVWAPGPEGLARVPITRGTHAWRVPPSPP